MLEIVLAFSVGFVLAVSLSMHRRAECARAARDNRETTERRRIQHHQ